MDAHTYHNAQSARFGLDVRTYVRTYALFRTNEDIVHANKRKIQYTYEKIGSTVDPFERKRSTAGVCWKKLATRYPLVNIIRMRCGEGDE